MRLTLRMNERYKIKIGQKSEKKTQSGHLLPEKLDHFIITTGEKDAAGRFIHDAEMMKLLGEKPKKIGIRFLYNVPELNIQSCFSYYKGSVCFCRSKELWPYVRTGIDLDSSGCDLTAIRRTEPAETVVKCPCEFLKRDPKGNSRCKPNVRLRCVLEEANRVGGEAVFRSTSWNSFMNLLGSVAFIYASTGGRLTGIAFQLVLSPKTVTKPDGGAQKVYVVSVEYDGSAEMLQDQAFKLNAISPLDRMRQIEAEQKQLLTSFTETPEDEKEIAEEFYPEQPTNGDHAMGSAGATRSVDKNPSPSHHTARPEANDPLTWLCTEDGEPINPETGEIGFPEKPAVTATEVTMNEQAKKPYKNPGKLFPDTKPETIRKPKPPAKAFF